jgi:hypothetical protein
LLESGSKWLDLAGFWQFFPFFKVLILWWLLEFSAHIRHVFVGFSEKVQICILAVGGEQGCRVRGPGSGVQGLGYGAQEPGPGVVFGIHG